MFPKTMNLGVRPCCSRSLFTSRGPLSRKYLSSLHHPKAQSGGAILPDDDPYELLGLKPGSSSDSILKSYKAKLKEAKSANNEQLVARIESAHSSIMMAQLTSRLKGQVSVASDIAYADKEDWIPWRPRWCPASKKLSLISIGINSALLLWTLVSASFAGVQPLIASMLSSAAVTYFKLEELAPSNGGLLFASSDASRSQGTKNLVRCILLPFMSTIAGVMLFVTLPDLFADFILSTKLPYWFYDFQTTILNVSGILSNTIVTTLYR